MTRRGNNNGVNVSKDNSGNIAVTFPYDPELVAKVKTIPGHRWHPAEKYWSFPNTDGTLTKILEVFKGEEICIDPALQAKNIPSPLAGEGKSLPRTCFGGEGGQNEG